MSLDGGLIGSGHFRLMGSLKHAISLCLSSRLVAKAWKIRNHCRSCIRHTVHKHKDPPLPCKRYNMVDVESARTEVLLHNLQDKSAATVLVL